MLNNVRTCCCFALLLMWFLIHFSLQKRESHSFGVDFCWLPALVSSVQLKLCWIFRPFCISFVFIKNQSSPGCCCMGSQMWFVELIDLAQVRIKLRKCTNSKLHIIIIFIVTGLKVISKWSSQFFPLGWVGNTQMNAPEPLEVMNLGWSLVLSVRYIQASLF